ncbi:MAG: hypothetical protein ACI4M5_01815 [Christensenellales bacterium]
MKKYLIIATILLLCITSILLTACSSLGDDITFNKSDSSKKNTKVVFDSIIKQGEFKVRGSGKTCNANFQLKEKISTLKEEGYDTLNICINYQLREEDNCWIFVRLYDEYNNVLYNRTVEHGGTSKNKEYSTYNLDIDVDLDDLISYNFTMEFKAEDKWFKDFYVGNVTGKVTAIKNE